MAQQNRSDRNEGSRKSADVGGRSSRWKDESQKSAAARERSCSANERFKRRAGGWFWPALLGAVIAHGLAFMLAPAMNVTIPWAGEEGIERHAMRAVRLPVELPPPPEGIAEPAVPVVAKLEPAFQELTIDPVTFDEFGMEIPPLPVVDNSDAQKAFRQWVPSMVKPELRNPEAVRRALVDRYPRHLVNAGIGAEVVIWFWIDEQGQVQRYEIKQSSGYDALDAAAVDVIDMMKFSPALNRGKPVAVMVALPITFKAR